MKDLNELMDDEENQAVRCFLMIYGTPGLEVGTMAKHMRCCGWDVHPEWATEDSKSHLTKAGAQIWLRQLFTLEDQLAIPLDAETVRKELSAIFGLSAVYSYHWEGYKQGANLINSYYLTMSCARPTLDIRSEHGINVMSSKTDLMGQTYKMGVVDGVLGTKVKRLFGA
jgi:hypothetical protein